MDQTRNQPSAGKFWSWFIPVGRQAGGWAFALNRVTAIGLTFYLFLHLGDTEYAGTGTWLLR